MNKENIFNSIIAGAGTLFTCLFGSWDLALQILIIFMVLDYCTGLIKAYVNKKVSSDTGLKGIARKSLILVVLMVAVMLDRLLNTDAWVFRTLVSYFYIANEGISLLENCAQLGVPIPEQVKDALIQLKQGNKKEIKEQE